MTFVGFLGTGYQEGHDCYFKTKSTVTANPKPFEIWANCRKIFQNRSMYLNEKPKLFFIQVLPGKCVNSHFVT